VVLEENNVSDDKGAAWTKSQPSVDEAPADWRDLRRQERAQRRDSRRGEGSWIGGIILIFLGVLFMLQNSGILVGGHWWALFILIPAIAMFAGAYRTYGWAGGFTPVMLGPLCCGVVLTTVSLIFLFGLDFGVVWPVFLILAGLGALVGGMFARH
jgi:hypothetical protein